MITELFKKMQSQNIRENTGFSSKTIRNKLLYWGNRKANVFNEDLMNILIFHETTCKEKGMRIQELYKEC